MAHFDFANRNYNARNHGMGNRDVARALTNGYKVEHEGQASIATYASHHRHFAEYLHNVHQIKDLRKVDESHVKGYGAYNLDRYLEGERGYSLSTIKNRISAVNEAMGVVKTDYTAVNPREMGFPRSSGIAEIDNSISDQKHAELVQQASPQPQLAAMLNAERSMGLRMKESSLMDAKTVLKNAESTGIINITAGTKGGKPRPSEYKAEQHRASLEQLAALQGDNRCIIPDNQTWAQWQNKYYAELSKIGGDGFHGERKFFAHEQYQKYSQKYIEKNFSDKSHIVIESPFRAGVEHKQHHTYIAEKLGISMSDAKELDKEARAQVANNLGHGRVDVTNAYLG